jgi:DNA polymerase-3 subunit epsilon
MGIETGKGACFAHQLQRCDGVCAGKESPELHYLRLKQALIPHRLKSWPYPGTIGIREHDEASGRSQLHIFDSWRHLGTVEDEGELEEVLQTRASLSFDLDIYKVLQKNLRKYPEVLSLGFSPAHRRVDLCSGAVPLKTRK